MQSHHLVVYIPAQLDPQCIFNTSSSLCAMSASTIIRHQQIRQTSSDVLTNHRQVERRSFATSIMSEHRFKRSDYKSRRYPMCKDAASREYIQEMHCFTAHLAMNECACQQKPPQKPTKMQNGEAERNVLRAMQEAHMAECPHQK